MEVIERRLIGALALSPDLIGEFDGRITPELFTDRVCRDLWAAMAAAHKERRGFEVTDVPVYVCKKIVEVKYRIANDLSRPVVSNISAPVDFEKFNAFFLQASFIE